MRGPEGPLAGSVLTMIDAVRNVHALGVPLEEALAAAAEVPARIAGRPDLGRLTPGAPADVVEYEVTWDEYEPYMITKVDRAKDGSLAVVTADDLTLKDAARKKYKEIIQAYAGTEYAKTAQAELDKLK